MLYSKGGIGQAIAEDWETVLNNFVLSLKTIQTFAPTPADVNGLSKKQKKTFIKLFRDLDHDYAQFKSFQLLNLKFWMNMDLTSRYMKIMLQFIIMLLKN